MAKKRPSTLVALSLGQRLRNDQKWGGQRLRKRPKSGGSKATKRHFLKM